MKMNKLIATALAVSLSATAAATPSMAAVNNIVVTPAPTTGAGGAWPVWVIGSCAASIILAAMQKNYLGKGELTPPEAWTCGLLEYYNAATGKLKFVPHTPITTLPERTN